MDVSLYMGSNLTRNIHRESLVCLNQNTLSLVPANAGIGDRYPIAKLAQITRDALFTLKEITFQHHTHHRAALALVVFEQKTGLKDIADTGMAIDATISGALLINIFEPNTPLHDGAVIVRGTRIVAAACVLTLSDASNISRDLGTRHRAGLGISESTDAVVLIVSEETGIISMAQAGKLTRHLDAEDLGRVLSDLYHDQRPTFRDALRAVGGRLRPGKQTTDDQ